MPLEAPEGSRAIRRWDLFFVLVGLSVLLLFVTRYQMPFRLDDVLLMEWSNAHSIWDAFDPIQGQMVNSVRPMFSVTAWILTHTAGPYHPFYWHLTLVLALLVGLAFTGLTARYLSRRAAAFEVSTILYWIAFLPILNVFFWFSDLTYGLELAFTAPAWYFALKGLYEGRLRSLLLGLGFASLAVLSKEPAVVLTHVVFLGSLALGWREVRLLWRDRRTPALWALVGYLLFCALTVYIITSSPTRINRFFPLDAPDLGFFIQDRIRFYSEIYTSISARLLLFLPIVYATTRSFRIDRIRWNAGGGSVAGLWSFLVRLVLAVVLTLLLFQNLVVATVSIFVLLSIALGRGDGSAGKFLPFALCLVIASVTLLVTIQLVKTQLTELAFLTILISGWGWCILGADLHSVYRSLSPSAMIGRTLLAAAIGLGLLAIVGAYPKLQHQEALLREVRDVRENANDAIQWAARHLPKHSLLAVGSYTLHGLEHGDELTSENDETKLQEQYTFVGGYVYIYLAQLGRSDIQHAYLEDSTLAPRVLEALRALPNSYVFLQTRLDLDLFHGRQGHERLLHPSDSLVAHFTRGPFPTEIWLLKH